MRKQLLLLILLPIFVSAQISDNFSDGNFTSNPEWLGDTSNFKITNSSAIPPEMKPALQLDGSGTDTSYLYLSNSLIENTEWQFWIKLSFNTSENNNARVYLVSDQPNLENELNGYFVQVGSTNDSIAFFKQTGSDIEKIISGTIAFTGNSTNSLRIKVTHEEDGNWSLFSDPAGGNNFELEGTSQDITFLSTNYFGIFCRYTSSNSTKFYFDDFYVNEIIIDTIPPEIQDLQLISQNQLDVYFNETLEILSAENVVNYNVSNIGNPALAQRDLADFSLVHIEFTQSFVPETYYTLFVSGISDIAGNIIESDSANFVYTEPQGIEPYDIVINEIMADVNPLPNDLPEADFLELYNRTGFPVDISNCTLKPRESSDPIIFPSIQIEPDSFLIVVKTSDVIDFEQYGQVVGLPNFSLNNEGTITLRNPDGNFIHSVSYTKDWYKDDVKKEGGWSIEQIDPGHPCTGEENWAATIDDSGGTPGKRNSIDNTILSLPEISKVEAIDEFRVSVDFTHFMDSLSIISTSAYLVDNGISIPGSVIIESGSFNSVILVFSSNFQQNVVYNLTIIDTIFNCADDYIEINSSYNFVLPSKAQPFDIVINEVMADPVPAVGLPEFEFVELYNTTSLYLEVKGWTLKVGTTDKTIPDFIIEPEEYVILTEDEAVNLFGIVARPFGFSTLGLTNSGTSLQLSDSEENLISSVTYSDDWYDDNVKMEGGWSLEQIDPKNPCQGKENWNESMAEEGGTPGALNSVYSDNLAEPLVEKVIAVNAQTFKVYFNQIMDEQSILIPSNYTIDKGIGNPGHIYIDGSGKNKVILEFDQPLLTKTIYTLTVSSGIKNCIGIAIPDYYSFEFGIAENAAKNDIVINEVLFNPVDDGVDFVEIYNNSEKIIDLKDLFLGTIDVNQFEPNDTTYKSVSEESGLMLMGNYLVLTKDPNKVKGQYFTENPESFVKMNSFPTYKNEEGTVILSGKNGVIVDAFNYNEEMHYPLLNSVDGVSLERINFNRPSEDKTNWHSASKQSGFATPAYKNSQFSDLTEAQDPVTLDPEIFSPDNDGYNDVLNVNYKFESPGYTANITIYDSQGRLVKYLVQNSLLGTEGTFSWDGRTEDNQKANIGIYIVYFEAFDMNGNVKKYKKSAVLGGKL
jgi:hypothetical protein